MSQHPQQRSQKSSGTAKSNDTDGSKSGHGNARESGKKGGGTTKHGRN